VGGREHGTDPGPPKERLGVSDRAVTANRRLLLKSLEAFEAGHRIPGQPRDEHEAAAMTGPVAVDMISNSEDWQTRWERHDRDRRATSPWASSATATEGSDV
jgi:phthalate 4,5-dioxygenase